ncbi:hypothetical protein ACOBR2_19330 [Telmatobacter bradus]|uniref:hypothetical protein n=1 Tax=Telmatobacter bradus TaxID=474953 RepID=UPI003B4374DD
MIANQENIGMRRQAPSHGSLDKSTNCGAKKETITGTKLSIVPEEGNASSGTTDVGQGIDFSER